LTTVVEKFCSKVISNGLNIEEAKAEAVNNFDDIYPDSIHEIDANMIFLARIEGCKKLVLIENKSPALTDEFQTESKINLKDKKIKFASLSHKNADVLRKLLPFTSPVTFGKNGMSMGLGDRLGLASPGHLRLIKNTAVKPVLAQQSIRELDLTERTYEEVMDAASWAVLQEGYHSGFGADGDHLKTEDEVKMALNLGFTMITLDCSEKINNDVPLMNDDEVVKAYDELKSDYRKRIEKDYLDNEFVIDQYKIKFDDKNLQRLALIYGKALDFIAHIFFDIVKPIGRTIDFEVSIDETQTPTTPEAHFFVASELEKMKVEVTSIAPRFCGEFQKGIDYIGDLDQFEKEFKVHAKIAEHFDYKLSIHSGSDKFKVFPIIGYYTKGRVHVKTAGTNWLEALKVIAVNNPSLFRRIYAFALEHFKEATKYYHVTTDLSKVPDITKLCDEELDKVLNQNDARQMLHITYGLILTARDANGKFLFRDELYETLNLHEDDYYKALERHIGKHIELLNSNR